MIKLIDPTRPNEQHARGLDLHLLEVGKDNNRNVLEMVKAGKNQIKVPTSFEDLSDTNSRVHGTMRDSFWNGK